MIKSKKMGIWVVYINVANNANPIIPKITPTITKIITAINDIAKAITHPQSKNFLTRANQMTNIMIAASKPKPGSNAPIIALIAVPRKTIHIASMNLALSDPTSHLPASHRNGATIIVPTTMLIIILIISNNNPPTIK